MVFIKVSLPTSGDLLVGPADLQCDPFDFFRAVQLFEALPINDNFLSKVLDLVVVLSIPSLLLG